MPQEENQELPTPKQQETLVTYETNGQTIQIDLKDVNKLFSDIHRYNDQFSLGSMMARIIRSRIESANEDGNETPTIGEEEQNQQIDAFFLASAHKNILENIGISLEPVAGKTGIIISEGDAAEAGQMRMNVYNHENFTSFLGALDPQQIETTGTKHHLEGLSSTLAQQVLDSYDLQAPGEEAIQLFSGLEKIVNEYKRLEMKGAVKNLETYLDHGKIGDLREYVAIERKGLLYEPKSGHFGPGDWQRDSTVNMLQARWDEALTVLKMTKDNPNAAKLYEQLRNNLTLCAEVAVDNWREIQSSYNSESFPHEKMSAVLEDAKQKIQELTSPNDEAN